MENTVNKDNKKRLKLGRFFLPGLGILCVLTVFFLFTTVFRTASMSVEIDEDMHRAVEKMRDSYQTYYFTKIGAINTISMTYEDELSTIASVLGDQGFYDFDEEQMVEACGNFKKIRERSVTDRLYVADKDGILRIASSPEYLGVDLVGRGHFSREEFEQLVNKANNEYLSKWLLVENDEGEYYYFIKKYEMTDSGLGNDLYFIAGVEADKVTGSQGLSIKTDSLVSDAEHYGINCHIIISDAETGKVVASSWDEIREGDNVRDFGFTDEVLTDGAMDDANINGEGYSYYSIASTTIDNPVIITGLVPSMMDTFFAANQEFASYEFESMRNMASVLVVMVIFVVLMTVFVGYGMSLKERSENKKSYLRKLSILSMAVLIAFSALTYLPLAWMSLTRQEIEAVSLSKRVLASVNDRKDDDARILNYYKNRQVASASLLAYALEEKGGELIEQGTPFIYYEADKNNRPVPATDFLGNPTVSYASSEYLKEKGEYLGANEVYILNEDGRTLVSSSDSWYYNMYQDKEVSEDYKRALFRQIPYFAGYSYDENKKLDGFYIAYPFDLFGISQNGKTRYVSRGEYEAQGKENGSITKAMGLLAYDIDSVPAVYNYSFIDYETSISNQANLHECSIIKMSDKADKNSEKEIFSFIHDLRELEAVTVPEGMKTDEYNYFGKMSGKDVYVHVEHDFDSGNYIFTIFDTEAIFENAFILTIIYVFGMLFMMLLVGGVMVFTYKANDNENYEGINTIRDALTIKENGVLEHRNARTYIFINIIVITLVLGVVLARYRAPKVLNGMVIFTNVFSEEWRRGFTSYNVIAALSLMITIFILMRFAKRLVGIISSILGRKGETIARISLSATQYLTYFAGLFYCTYLLGLELKSVTTLATVSVGVIGLGSQQLISDIFSGLSILAEGNFKVGDRIIVNGFNGVVKDIGIRSTKIVADSGQIQSVANGNMKTIIIVPDGPKPEEKKTEETKQ